MPNPEVYQTSKSGERYRVRFRLDGKYSSKTFATMPEAQMFCRDIANRGAARAVEDLDYERNEANELTLDQWAEIHFSALTKPAAATVSRYRRIYRTIWQPQLGHMPLSRIGRVDVARALNTVTGKDKTVMNAWGVLTHMLKMAAQDGLINRSPTIGVQLSRSSEHEDVEHRYLSHAEFWRIYDATPPYWRPLIMTLAGTGMRWGELAALTVGDVDLENAVIRITKAEKEDPDNPGRKIIGPTKSRKSKRTITIGDEVVEALTPLLGRPRTARLFLPPKGGPLRHSTFYYDIWQGRCLGVRAKKGRKAPPARTVGDPQPRLHDLRHTHVAWLIALGVSLAVIQARLGHDKITTTIDTYGHLEPEIQRAAADAASLVLGRRPLELP